MIDNLYQTNYYMWTLKSELVHLIVGLPFIYWVFRKTKSKLAIWVTFFYIFFMDVDHLFDYVMHKGFPIDLEYIKHINFFVESGKMYLPLHAFEYVLIFAWLAKKWKKYDHIFIALATATFAHLVVDQAYYGLWSLRYFLLCRILVKFNFFLM